jgi:hypothetical protein
VLIVPLNPIPSQTLSITLNGQPCKIHVYQRTTGLFLDLSVNDALVVGGVICHDRNLLIRYVYLGFSGDLAFVDQKGRADPVFIGLGTRWTLDYFLPTELVVPTAVAALWVPAAATAQAQGDGAPLPPFGITIT